MAKVLGIGVAVMTNTCGGMLDFFQSLALWATPNRCCSSITAKPKFLNCTTSSIIAWVPTTKCISSSNKPFNILLRSPILVLPVNNAISIGISFNNSVKLS